MTEKITDLKTNLYDILSNHNVINLAYTDESNTPQCCALWYAADNKLSIYYLSELSTLHGSSLQDGGKVAFTINRDDQSWQEIVGIQGKGVVELLGKNRHAWEIYTSKYPFVLEQFPELQSALNSTQLWSITPTWFRLIDNRVEFGHKQEIQL